MPEDKLIGCLIEDRFRIISKLGSGGMGSVYLAQQSGLERMVAVKFMHEAAETNEEDRSRFMREAQILSRIDHPGVVKVLCFGFLENGQAYMVMEYVEGRSLRQILNDLNFDPGGKQHLAEKQEFRLGKQETKLPWNRAALIAAETASAMAAAHKQGIIHRDLKPENVILCAPEYKQVKVIDFGLGKFQNPERKELNLTETGILIGSVNYMSPEQARGGKADERSDIYSLACLLYESLSGLPPFQADTAMGVIYKQINETPPEIKAAAKSASLPAELDMVLAKALSKDPLQRYQSMAEFEEDLRDLSNNNTVALSQRLRAFAKTQQASQRKVTILVVLCSIPLTLALLLMLFQSRAVKQLDGEKASPTAGKKKSVKRLPTFGLLAMDSRKLLSRIEQLLFEDHFNEAEALMQSWKNTHESRAQLSAEDEAVLLAGKGRLILPVDPWQARRNLEEAYSILLANPNGRNLDLRVIVLCNLISADLMTNEQTISSKNAAKDLESIVKSKVSLSSASRFHALKSLAEYEMKQDHLQKALSYLQSCESKNDLHALDAFIQLFMSKCLFLMNQESKAKEAAFRHAGNVVDKFDLNGIKGSHDYGKEARRLQTAARCAAFAYRWDLALQILDPALKLANKCSEREQAPILMDRASWRIKLWSGLGKKENPSGDRRAKPQQWLQTLNESKSDFEKSARIYFGVKDLPKYRKALLGIIWCQILLDQNEAAEETLKKALVAHLDEDQEEINFALASDLLVLAKFNQSCSWKKETIALLKISRNLFQSLRTRGSSESVKDYMRELNQSLKLEPAASVAGGSQS